MPIGVDLVASCLVELARSEGRFVVERLSRTRIAGRWVVSHTALAEAAGRLSAGVVHPSFEFLSAQVVELLVTEHGLVIHCGGGTRFEIVREGSTVPPQPSYAKRPPTARVH